MPARLCQQWRIQGRAGAQEARPPYVSLFLNQTEARRAGKFFWHRALPLSQGLDEPRPPPPPPPHFPYPYVWIRHWSRSSTLLFILCQGHEKVYLRTFCKTKPLSASFPLKNFNPFHTNFTFFINSFVYLSGRLRRRELTREHRNSQRVDHVFIL